MYVTNLTFSQKTVIDIYNLNKLCFWVYQNLRYQNQKCLILVVLISIHACFTPNSSIPLSISSVTNLLPLLSPNSIHAFGFQQDGKNCQFYHQVFTICCRLCCSQRACTIRYFYVIVQ